MTFDIDVLLLDRAFQPISERLAAWLNCFALARGALFGIVVLQTVILARALQVRHEPMALGWAAAATLLQYYVVPFVYSHVRRAERQARPGLLNPQRIALRPARLAWLGCTLVIGCAWLGAAFRSFETLQFTLACLWCSALYFQSCSPAPPRLRAPRRAFWELAVAGGPGGASLRVQPSAIRGWHSPPRGAKLVRSRTAERVAPFSARRRPGWPKSRLWSRTTRCPVRPPSW